VRPGIRWENDQRGRGSTSSPVPVFLEDAMRSFSPAISPRSIKCAGAPTASAADAPPPFPTRQLAMRFASLAAVCLAAAGAVSAVPAAAPAPSGTPCTYSCPAADEAGFELGRSSKPNANTLRCDYPGTPGETGLYFCNYNSAVRRVPPLSGFH
jgi:hypothetical protein